MTTHIVARFADGKMLVREEKLVAQQVYADGLQVRIGHVAIVDQVLSVTTDIERYGLVTPLALVSAALDTVKVRAFRGDFAAINAVSVSETGSGNAHVLAFSGVASLYTASGLISGLLWNGEMLSGCAVSGVIKVTVNVIGH